MRSTWISGRVKFFGEVEVRKFDDFIADLPKNKCAFRTLKLMFFGINGLCSFYQLNIDHLSHTWGYL